MTIVASEAGSAGSSLLGFFAIEERRDRLKKGLGVDRLGNEPVAPRLADPLLVACHGVGTDGEDRDGSRLRVLSKHPGECQAINMRQVDVEQDEVRPMRLGLPHHLLPIIASTSRFFRGFGIASTS